MNEILLTGCAPTPLAHYLKALGVFRIIAKQKDKNATGAWREDGFLLRTHLNIEELIRFFLYDYHPTPVFTPWNNGSGFYYREDKTKEIDPETGKKIKTGARNTPTKATKTIDELISAKAERLFPCAGVARTLKEIIEAHEFNEAPKDKLIKQKFIGHIRSRVDEMFLSPLDSCVTLTDESSLFPPIFGTGGNDGNLEFTKNFNQQVLRLMDKDTGEPTSNADSELKGALFHIPVPHLTEGAIGQFSPGHAGGPNSNTDMIKNGLVNGWDYVLMMEGALLFASGISRRLETAGKAILSYPFTVRLSGSGSGTAATSDESDSRNEIWMPLWKRPASLIELETILREGRASLKQRGCRDGLDFIRAVAQLGIDRGVDAFQRFGFLKRSGLLYLATPMGKVEVRHTPEAMLIEDLDKRRWLHSFRMAVRSKEAGNQLETIMQRLENRLFDLARKPARSTVYRLLETIGELSILQGKSARLRENNAVIPTLTPNWLKATGNPDDAFRIACALASIGGKGKLPFRAHLFPLENPEGRKLQKDGQSKICTWGHSPLPEELSRLLERRLLSARQGANGLVLSGTCPVGKATIVSYLENPELDETVARLLPGLSLIEKIPYLPGREVTDSLWPPLAYRILKPFFSDHSELVKTDLFNEDTRLPLLPELVRFLRSNQPERALKLATRKLRIAGLNPPPLPPDTTGLNGKRLLAALLIPIYTATLKSFINATFNITTNEIENESISSTT